MQPTALGRSSLRLELVRRLNEAIGVSMSADKVAKRPWFAESRLKSATAMQQFVGILDWVVEEIKES